MKKFQGQAWCVGDDIDTDVIIAARYLNDASDENLRKHCLEDAIPQFFEKIKPGDILVAGKNFGCGSSREHAPIALKVAGVACVVAESFARIFYRNAINIGLPIIIAPEAVQDIKPGDELDIDPQEGVLINKSTGNKFSTETFPVFIQELINTGNLLNYVKKKVNTDD